MSRNKGNFLCFAHNLIQEPCRSPFCFPCGVGVDVHCRTDIRGSELFLHIFGFCTAWSQIACVGMAECVEMEVLQAFNLCLCLAANLTDCTCRNKSAVLL